MWVLMMQKQVYGGLNEPAETWLVRLIISMRVLILVPKSRALVSYIINRCRLMYYLYSFFLSSRLEAIDGIPLFLA